MKTLTHFWAGKQFSRWQNAICIFDSALGVEYLRSNEQSLNLVVKNWNNKCRQIIKKKVIFLPEFPFKMRDYKDRRVTPPKQVTLPTCGPSPPCKQALSTEPAWATCEEIC